MSRRRWSCSQTTASKRPSHARPLTAATLPRTVTPKAFAFTDLAGSTELADRLSDRRFAGLIRTHNAVVRGTLARHHGLGAGFLGDGFLLTFTDAGDAVAFSVALQRAVDEHLPADIHVRIGVHAGVAEREGRTWLGRDVVIARRLCELAQPGEVLVSARVRALAPRRTARYGDPRRLPLKGLARPVAACALSWR